MSERTERQLKIGVSGAHGTGKTTLVEDICLHLPGYASVEEPYFTLEAEGYIFAYPPSVTDYRAQLHCSEQTLRDLGPPVVYDRTPLDFLAYLAALGVNIDVTAESPGIRAALAGLEVLVIVPITPETERVLPTPEYLALQVAMNDALLDLVSEDPFDIRQGVHTLELSVPLDARIEAVLATLTP